MKKATDFEVVVETTRTETFTVEHELLKDIVYGSHYGKHWEADCPDRKFTVNAVAILADLMHAIPRHYTSEIDEYYVSLEVELSPSKIEGQPHWSVEETATYIAKVAQWLKDRNPIECIRQSEIQACTLDQRYKHFNIIVPTECCDGKILEPVYPFYFDSNGHGYTRKDNPVGRLYTFPGTQYKGEVTAHAVSKRQ